MDDSQQSIDRDIAAIQRISAVPSMLHIICESTGMGFAAVARVTDGDWTACAVQDNIQFGLKPGGRLDVTTTLCREARAARQPVVIDHASQDPVYSTHHTPRIYKIESYISVPIVLRNGEYFGNLCAIDPRPAKVSDAKTVAVFERFAELISLQLESEQRREETESALLSERATAELREHFIAVLGHDLRNPLSSVGMAGEVLARRSEPELVTLGQRLRNSTQRMSKLIDDVLDLARGRLGQGIGVTLGEGANLARLLDDVVEELRSSNPERDLVSHVAIDMPVRCDPARMQQLLSNLLGNALAYGAADKPVRVDVRIESGALQIAVSNEGNPIPAENQAAIFKPYSRPGPQKAAAGLGLGLYICAEIVKAHEGTLQVTSSAEQGTRFVARIPLG